MSIEQAREFARGAFNASVQTFADIANEFEPYRKIYTDCVEPIRHTVFAHAGQLNRAARDALFTKVAERKYDTPRLHWVVEKLEEFARRAFGARTLRDPTIARRDAR